MHQQKQCLSNKHRCPADFCGYLFESTVSLSRHIQTIHKNQNVYLCSKCIPIETRFKTRSLLDTHLINKHNILPYPCGSCDKSYKSSNSLHRHEKCHNEATSTFTGNITCEICKHNFASTQALTIHNTIVPRKCQTLRAEKELVVMMGSLGLPQIPPPQKTSFGLFFA